ncbi:MAG TPA: hypothetical protein VFM19_04135 [Candidatus Limnocylindria bacterium]|nr:hypothetical protein [Candidatus Limnocylindria bacterium]
MELLQRRWAWIEAATWVLAAIGTASFAAFLVEIVQRDGGRGYDLHAYLLAARHALEGQPLYAEMQIGDPGAFRYPPTFAYLAIPLALPPELAVTWAYRVACLACVRYLTGSWRWTGVALLFQPLQIELAALNVTLPIAAAARAALRGARTGAALTPTAAALKYGAALLAPFLWWRRPATRRALAIGLAVLVAAFALHALLRPDDWAAYLGSLAQQSTSANQAPFVGEQLLVLVPSTLWDFVVRFTLCALATAVAIRQGWGWLAFTAAALAVPTLWVARLAALVGVPRLWWEERVSRAGSAAAGPRA